MRWAFVSVGIADVECPWRLLKVHCFYYSQRTQEIYYQQKKSMVLQLNLFEAVMQIFVISLCIHYQVKALNHKDLCNLILIVPTTNLSVYCNINICMYIYKISKYVYIRYLWHYDITMMPNRIQSEHVNHHWLIGPGEPGFCVVKDPFLKGTLPICWAQRRCMRKPNQQHCWENTIYV